MKTTLLACWSLAAFLGLTAACATPDEATIEDANAAQSTPRLDLATVLPELAGSGIQGTVRKLVDPRLQNLSEAEDRYYLEVRLGRLTRPQFDRVKALFDDHSRVPYDAARDYELTDFLHPAMQAITNQTYTGDSFGGSALADHMDAFEGDAVFYDFMKNGVGVMTNCYGTTAELLRQLRPGAATKFNLYFPDRNQASEWFSDTKYSDVVPETDRKHGDALVVRVSSLDLAGNMLLTHTAFVLSKELVFEKTDVMDDDPYRISLRRDVLAKYDRIGKREGGVSYEIRRFGAGKTALPAPKVPTAEIPAKLQTVLRQAYPTIDPANVTLAYDVGMGGGNNSQFNEIKPATVITDSRTGRGLLQAPQSTLRRFVALRGR
jgi:hypothetical protein